MEFKAIIDHRARESAGCAVAGVYENGDLGAAARHIDAQTGGLIAQLQSGGDFAAKVGDTLLLSRPAGAACERVLLVGLGPRAGFGRKQYRKALQAAAQALAKTGASDALVYLALEAVGGVEMHYRARMVAEIFCAQTYRIPDLKTGAKPKAGQTCQRQRGGGGRACGESRGGWVEDRCRHRQRARLVARPGEPAAQHLHAHLSRATRRSAWPRSGRASRPRCWTKAASGP